MVKLGAKTKKKYNIKPNLRQRRAVEIMAEKRGSLASAIREAGYSETVVRTPSKLTRTDSFQKLCEEHGLTDMLVLDSLVEDIKGKPKNRVQELTLAAKIKGMIDKQDDNNNNSVIIFNIPGHIAHKNNIVQNGTDTGTKSSSNGPSQVQGT